MVNKNYVQVTKSATFEMAHALDTSMGKCANIHGHSYKLWITIGGTIDKENNKNVVIDFRTLKELIYSTIIEKYDHSFVLFKNKKNEALKQHLESLGFQNIILLPFQPTTENLTQHFVSCLQEVLPPDITLEKLRLQETENSYAEWDFRG